MQNIRSLPCKKAAVAPRRRSFDPSARTHAPPTLGDRSGRIGQTSGIVRDRGLFYRCSSVLSVGLIRAIVFIQKFNERCEFVGIQPIANLSGQFDQTAFAGATVGATVRRIRAIVAIFRGSPLRSGRRGRRFKSSRPDLSLGSF